ncbi:hypothetical protein GPECTOR_191g301 [Gonium pectorale]|uniref:Pyridine nucleotide-disulphide oxidoreductase N-terminal domain-containing protein n=1 Tax=Gonium pectorale TaxID=33097 RepID=A0A150FX42_GONPE|nr:hypothetical protein GPECTOR_191g301 [Gonium pectorale]|eukprot:KXZ42169.1 hypothetical protein GPECTOR_191g301 [Gonium pectorale]
MSSPVGKDYLEINWAAVRGVVDPATAARITIPYKELSVGRFVQAAVTRLTPREAHLSQGDVLRYDYAAICTGGSYSGGALKARAVSRDARLRELQETAAEVAEAFAGKRVTLVQSGPRLLEAAPPAASKYCQRWLEARGVQVLLGHRVLPGPATKPPDPAAAAAPLCQGLGQRPCHGTGQSALDPQAQGATDAPRRRGEGLTLAPDGPDTGTAGVAADGSPAAAPASATPGGDGVIAGGCDVDTTDAAAATAAAGAGSHGAPPSAAVVLTTDRGGALAADLVLWCVAGGPVTAFMRPDLAGCLDERGAVKVLPSLQLPAHPHIFALGDCNDVAESKLGYLAMKQAELAAANLQVLVRNAVRYGGDGGGQPRLATWRPGMGMPALMMVTLGRRDGVLRLGGCGLGGLIPRLAKSGDLMVARTRGMLPLVKAGGSGGGAGGRDGEGERQVAGEEVAEEGAARGGMGKRAHAMHGRVPGTGSS